MSGLYSTTRVPLLGPWRSFICQGGLCARLGQLSDEMKSYLRGPQGFHGTDGGLINYIQRHLPKEAVEKKTVAGERPIWLLALDLPEVWDRLNKCSHGRHFDRNSVRDMRPARYIEREFVSQLIRIHAGLQLPCNFQPGAFAHVTESVRQTHDSRHHLGGHFDFDDHFAGTRLHSSLAAVLEPESFGIDFGHE